MRRLRILLYWLFGKENNVSAGQLLRFLTKPRMEKIASKFIDRMEAEEPFTRVFFKGVSMPLYWPISLPASLLHQVTAETFDANDWHYYQKPSTLVDQDEILLDIGAAEGLFSLTVAPRCRQLILVEPNSLFCASLQKSFAPYSNKTTLYQTAVGNSQGVVSFAENHLAGQISHEGGTQVPITTIDMLIPERQEVTFLKADIEGFEFEMLQGAKNTIIRNRPKMAITTYHNENNAQAIIDLILGYVPSYKYRKEGIFEKGGKPVMVHFWH
ncbi:MAG: FkbM family methyltransferase [Chitinophagaceae bacterium]|jgi:FkbM family methyltransferase|nr:FkbM family methyltransferase [Chitinophagaceae bacterium]